MKDRIIIGLFIVLCAGVFFVLNLACFPYVSYASDIIFVGNMDVPVNSLSKEEIRSIFLGEMIMWGNTRKITFVILKTKPHDDFLSKYIGNTAAQYRNYWRKMVFTGKSRSPRSFKTVKELLGYIVNTSGAIGYIPAGAYSGEEVKIISVKEEMDE